MGTVGYPVKKLHELLKTAVTAAELFSWKEDYCPHNNGSKSILLLIKNCEKLLVLLAGHRTA